MNDDLVWPRQNAHRLGSPMKSKKDNIRHVRNHRTINVEVVLE